MTGIEQRGWNEQQIHAERGRERRQTTEKRTNRGAGNKVSGFGRLAERTGVQDWEISGGTPGNRDISPDW